MYCYIGTTNLILSNMCKGSEDMIMMKIKKRQQNIP